MRTREIVVIALVALGAAAVGAGIALYFVGTTRVEVAAGAMRGEALSLNAPAGALTTETNTAYKAPPGFDPCCGDGTGSHGRLAELQQNAHF